MAPDMDGHVSKTSPVVRQLCPYTRSPHDETFSHPYSQSENTMSRFCAQSARPITQ